MIDPSPAYRKQILDALIGEDFKSIIEIGCGEGYNLVAIAENHDVEITGIDSEHRRIKFAEMLIQENGKVIKLIDGCGSSPDIPSKSYDIAFTYAVLTMITSDVLVEEIVKNMIRIARKKIIIIELNGEKWHSSGGRFSRDYVEILNKLGITNITKKQIPKEIWAGTSYPSFGYIIKATL